MCRLNILAIVFIIGTEVTAQNQPERYGVNDSQVYELPIICPVQGVKDKDKGKQSSIVKCGGYRRGIIYLDGVKAGSSGTMYLNALNKGIQPIITGTSAQYANPEDQKADNPVKEN